jgi:hypothetical protein
VEKPISIAVADEILMDELRAERFSEGTMGVVSGIQADLPHASWIRNTASLPGVWQHNPYRRHLNDLIALAYGLHAKQIVSGLDWFGTDL